MLYWSSFLSSQTMYVENINIYSHIKDITKFTTVRLMKENKNATIKRVKQVIACFFRFLWYCVQSGIAVNKKPKYALGTISWRKNTLCSVTKSKFVKNIKLANATKAEESRKNILIGCIKKSLIMINNPFKISIYGILYKINISFWR